VKTGKRRERERERDECKKVTMLIQSVLTDCFELFATNKNRK
jgi:hypothetical protein